MTNKEEAVSLKKRKKGKTSRSQRSVFLKMWNVVYKKNCKDQKLKRANTTGKIIKVALQQIPLINGKLPFLFVLFAGLN